MSQKPFFPLVNILGVKIHLLDMQQAKDAVFRWLETNKQYQINTPNPEQIVLAQKNKAFCRVLNQGDLNIPDGAGIVWAIKKGLSLEFSKDRPLINLKRVTGTDLMMELCKEAGIRGKRVFLLGGKPGVAEKAANLLVISYKLLVNSYSGAENIRQETEEERTKTITIINHFRPDLLFVAYGAPYQELWIAKNLPHLKVKVAMSVGGALDYIAGNVKRAPAWAREAGLEWLYRLIREPWRWKRQVNGLRFFLEVLTK